MVEVTRITTIEITDIAKVKDASEISPKEELEKYLRGVLDDNFYEPGLIQIKIQDFIMEKGDADEQSAAANEEG